MQTDGGFTGTVHSVRRFRACVCCPEKGVDSYMTERLRGQWKQRDMEWKVFVLFLSGMAVYYGYRLFALTPWYDELYTYYYFISRGPVYAAIHWPLPNNHVGYSVLSGILNLFGRQKVFAERRCAASGFIIRADGAGQSACGSGKRICARVLPVSDGGI